MYPGEGAYRGGERYTGGGLDPGEQTTGTRDEQYNLVSVLYHSLQGAETIEAYVLDAEAVGDERLAAFFREAQATYRQLAERAKERLGVLEVPPEPELAPDVPPEGGLSPGDMAGGIPPRLGDVEPGGMAPPSDTAASPGTPPGARDIPPEVPPTGDPLGAAPGDVPPQSADIQREPGVRDDVGVPPEEVPPTTDIPRTPPGMTPPPDEDVVAEPRGIPPEDVLQRGTSPEVPPREVPPEAVGGAATEGVLPGRAPDVPPPGVVAGEPGRATPGQRAAIPPEREQEEEKDLIDKAKDKLTEVKDKLTGQDRPPER